MPRQAMDIDKPKGKEGWYLRRLFWTWRTDAARTGIGAGLIDKTMLNAKTTLDTSAIMAEDFHGSNFAFLGAGPA